MKCLNCGRQFVNPKWPKSYRAIRNIYRRIGQFPGERFGAFTCSVKCNHAICDMRRKAA